MYLNAATSIYAGMRYVREYKTYEERMREKEEERRREEEQRRRSSGGGGSGFR